MAINQIALAGRMGGDVELTYKDSGSIFGKFSLAVDRAAPKDEDGNKQTDWFNCKVFNKTAEIMKDYAKKGTSVTIVGRFEVDTVERDGMPPATFYNVVVQDVQIQGRAGNSSDRTPSAEELANSDNDGWDY